MMPAAPIKSRKIRRGSTPPIAAALLLAANSLT
jgi:hypothetical protein